MGVGDDCLECHLGGLLCCKKQCCEAQGFLRVFRVSAVSVCGQGARNNPLLVLIATNLKSLANFSGKRELKN